MNIVWASTSQAKLKKILTEKKHLVQIIFNANKATHARPLFQELNIFDSYQINLLQANAKNLNIL